ncbi:hypothetical protein [Streptomyces sp. NPDC052107]|uniref:hypothetical protein n=1 Tax=Streptomyces sp. NPDC052107 TaxID=3155632 RepID=UPI003438E172
MERVLVAGISGAGESTPARSVSGVLGLPYHEMDALYFTGPGWAVNSGFAEEVSRVAAGPRWIVDSIGYPEVRDLLWGRAGRTRELRRRCPRLRGCRLPGRRRSWR